MVAHKVVLGTYLSVKEPGYEIMKKLYSPVNGLACIVLDPHQANIFQTCFETFSHIGFLHQIWFKNAIIYLAYYKYFVFGCIWI